LGQAGQKKAEKYFSNIYEVSYMKLKENERRIRKTNLERLKSKNEREIMRKSHTWHKNLIKKKEREKPNKGTRNKRKSDWSMRSTKVNSTYGMRYD